MAGTLMERKAGEEEPGKPQLATAYEVTGESSSHGAGKCPAEGKAADFQTKPVQTSKSGHGSQITKKESIRHIHPTWIKLPKQKKLSILAPETLSVAEGIHQHQQNQTPSRKDSRVS